MDDVIFAIVDQIDYGIDKLENPELLCQIAMLNKSAGIKAGNFSDYVTARSYFNVALKLTPENHWVENYEGSLELYSLLAKSNYSCGDADETRNTVQHILDHAHCLDDKLEAYHLLSLLLRDGEEMLEAYNLITSLLTQLGEEFPEMISATETKQQLQTTSKMLRSSSGVYLRMSDGKMDKRTEFVLKFYDHVFTVAYSLAATKAQFVPYIACKMVQLSVKHGSSKYFMFGKSSFDII